MYEDIFAKRLEELRVRKNVSAREMSLAIGQNVNYINRIENKQNFPSMQGFFYICEYLNISPQEFFETNSANPQKLNTLMEILKTLNSKQLQIIEDIACEFKHYKNK